MTTTPAPRGNLLFTLAAIAVLVWFGVWLYEHMSISWIGKETAPACATDCAPDPEPSKGDGSGCVRIMDADYCAASPQDDGGSVAEDPATPASTSEEEGGGTDLATASPGEAADVEGE